MCRSTEDKKQQLALPAGVTAGIATMMAHPLAVEAAVTPSLKNLLGSVAAGGAVLAAIFVAITTIANFDPLTRGRK